MTSHHFDSTLQLDTHPVQNNLTKTGNSPIGTWEEAHYRCAELTSRVGRWWPEVSSFSSWERWWRCSAARSSSLCAYSAVWCGEPTDVAITARLNSALYQAQDSGLSVAAIINICQLRQMDALATGKKNSSVCVWCVFACVLQRVTEIERDLKEEKDEGRERETDSLQGHVCVNLCRPRVQTSLRGIKKWSDSELNF